MGLFNMFNKKKDTENYSSSYSSIHEFDSYYSSSQSNLAKDDGSKDDEYDYDDVDFEIDFFKELSNGALIFKIIDDNFDPAGHIVLSASGSVTIIESGFHEYDEEDKSYLKQQVEIFRSSL